MGVVGGRGEPPLSVTWGARLATVTRVVGKGGGGTF